MSKPIAKAHMFIFNGPPRSGKDAAHNVDTRTLPREYVYIRERMSRPLKNGIISIYSLNGDAAAYHERIKDQKSPRLLGETYRMAQIALFNHLAMEHGQTVLGELLLSRLQFDWLLTEKLVVLLPDGGREVEVKPLLEYFNIHIIQLMREGTTFEGDIRSYIEPEGCTVTQIDNNGTERELHDRVCSYITAVLTNEND